MNNFSCFGKKLEVFFSFSCFYQSFSCWNHSFFYFYLFHVNPFWIQLSYYIIVSIFGHLALMVSKPRTAWFRPMDFDMFFMSVSATTVSSMSTNESEIYGHHYAKIVIYPKKTLRIYYAHWWRNVMDRATVTEWAVYFKQRFCNALAAEHKYSDSLPID